MSKVKVAIIGCGGIANQKHFPALKNNSDLNEIVAFCDIKIERAQKAAAEFGVAGAQVLSLIHISEPTRLITRSRMPSSA